MNKQTITMAEQYKYNRSQILFLTEMDEEEYNHFVCETADAWMRRNFKHLPEAEQILHSMDFWRWFKMHWQDWDDRFVLQELYNVPAGSRFVKYRQWHQNIFDKMQITVQYIYDDFLDMYKNFSYETKV